MYWLLYGGEKDGMMHTGECVTFYLPILPIYLFRSHVSIPFAAEICGGNVALPRRQYLVFYFVWLHFAITKFAHNNIAMYIHYIHYLVTPKKKQKKKISHRSCKSCPRFPSLTDMDTLVEWRSKMPNAGILHPRLFKDVNPKKKILSHWKSNT